MKDRDIRQILGRFELKKYLEDPESKVVEELRLAVARAQIDIAVINGHLHGYEIKSASDTLTRWPDQLEAYTKIFDYLTVVTEEKHAKKLLKTIPDWVGLVVCDSSGTKRVKKDRVNKNKQGFYLAKLLWREEIIDLLKFYRLPYRSKDRNWILCEILAENLSIREISTQVREKLKLRMDWKVNSAFD